jgi:hypothetical protein
MAIVLPCPCSTSIWRSFVTICSAASFFLAIFFLLSSSILSYRLVQKKPVRSQGGEFSKPCPVAWWNTERWGGRFYWGKLNPRDPFSTAIGGDHFQWIFIKVDSFQTFLNSLNHTQQATAGGEAKCKSALIAEMLKGPTFLTPQIPNPATFQQRGGLEKQPSEYQVLSFFSGPGLVMLSAICVHAAAN